MKISVIMASYLGLYPGSASNKESKFLRSVKSFINQSYENSELIIISDGCVKTIDLYNKYFSNINNIKLLKLNKQPLYSGNVRNSGFSISNGDIITYLDNDDIFGKDHLKIINDQFDIEKNEWVYYDDYMTLNKEFTKFYIRKVETRWASIGTSSISHKNPKFLKNGKYLKWPNGYGHDFLFVFKLNSMGLTFKKLEKMPQYIVCHYRNGDF